MEWYTVKKGRDTMNVRPRGLEQLLAQGWRLEGANQEPEASKPLATPVDSGPIKVKPRKKS